MKRWENKVAVVTGASKGIGKTIADALVQRGLKVVAIARNTDSITQINGKLYALSADVRKEEDIVRAFKWVLDTVGPVSVLVNNAGIYLFGQRLLDGNSQTWRDVFGTNVIGLCIATREATRQMMKSNIDGHVIHINSITGHKVITEPPINVYPASKYAVTALTETLRQELNAIKSKIKITSISPGPVDTCTFNDSVQDLNLLDSLDVADAVCYVLGTPPHLQVHELILQPVGFPL